MIRNFGELTGMSSKADRSPINGPLNPIRRCLGVKNVEIGIIVRWAGMGGEYQEGAGPSAFNKLGQHCRPKTDENKPVQSKSAVSTRWRNTLGADPKAPRNLRSK